MELGLPGLWSCGQQSVRCVSCVRLRVKTGRAFGWVGGYGHRLERAVGRRRRGWPVDYFLICWQQVVR